MLRSNIVTQIKICKIKGKYDKHNLSMKLLNLFGTQLDYNAWSHTFTDMCLKCKIIILLTQLPI